MIAPAILKALTSQDYAPKEIHLEMGDLTLIDAFELDLTCTHKKRK